MYSYRQENKGVPKAIGTPFLLKKILKKFKGDEVTKKVEMIIRPEKLEDVKETLNELAVFGMTVTMISGCGKQKGRKNIYRGTESTINLLPKIKVETVVHDEVVAQLIAKITEKIQTGEVGDGKIFVYNVEQAVKIRTGESGDAAL